MGVALHDDGHNKQALLLCNFHAALVYVVDAYGLYTNAAHDG
jgi:hypothetical protein